MADERFHRPEPQRKGPDRRFANVLRSAGSMRDPDDPGPGDPAEAAGGFVAEGVRGAYEVIDAYMRQGQRVARSLGLPTYGSVSPDQMSDLSSRWVQASSELMSVWFEFMTSVAESMSLGAPRAGAENGERRGSSGPAPEARGFEVDYEIRSHLPARPRLEFLPGRATPDLATHGLRTLGSDARPVDVSFEPGPEGRRIVVKIRVHKSQEPGLYTGALLDAHTGETVGSLSLRLG